MTSARRPTDPAPARRTALAPRAALLLVLSLCVACSTEDHDVDPAPTASATDARPNLLVVCIDTLRADRLGFMGYERPTSPFLDELAGAGHVFTSAFSTYPRTPTSIASLFTSLYPTTHGTIERPNLPLATTTFAERFSAAGWSTAAVVTNPHLSPGLGFDQGFDSYVYLSGPHAKSQPRSDALADGRTPSSPDVRYARSEGALYYARGDGVNAAALDWLDEPRDTPFLLYLHYMDVHNPYVSPAPYQDMFVTSRARDLYCKGTPPPDVEVTDADVEFMGAIYDGQVRYVDELLRELFTQLERRGVLDDTLLVFTSDHGDELFEHGGFGHGTTLYDELIHVPLLVWAPGTVPPGRTDGVVSLLDVSPTLAELYGLPPGSATSPDGRLRQDSPAAAALVQGLSLSATLVGPPRPATARAVGSDHAARPFVMAECITARDESGAWRPQIAVVDDDFHLLHRFETGASRLYDRRRDPGQSRDIFPAAGADADRLAREAAALLTRCRTLAPLFDAPTIEYDERTREQLRALGYFR